MRNIFELQKVNGFLIAIGSFSFAGVQFLQMLWLSKAYGADALGMVSIVLGFFSPFLSFLASGQRFSILTNTDLVLREHSIHFFIRMSLTILVLTGFWLFVELTGADWNPGTQVFLAVGFYKVFDAVLELDAWFKQKENNVKDFVLITLFRVIPIPLATFFSYVFKFSLHAYLWLALIILLLCLSFKWVKVNFRNGRATKDRLRFGDIASTIVLIFPVGVAAGVESLAVTIPRYYLASFGNLKQVALFVLFTQVSIVFGMVASARLQANIPMYARLAKTDPGELGPALSRSLVFLSVTILSLSVPFLLFPSEWVAMLVGSWVLEYSNIFLALPLVACVWYVGGYANQVSAIVVGRRYLVLSSVLMAVVAIVAMFIGHFVHGNALVVAVLALALGFLARGVLSGLSFFIKR